MRLHGRSKRAIAVLVALAPAAASALDYVGRLGLAYDRIESWSDSSYSMTPRLRLDGNLDAYGFLVEPGIVDWSGRVGYADLNERYGEANTKQNALTYGAQLDLLQKREAMARLSASATRTRTDYSTDAQVVQTTGAATTETYSLSAGAGPPGLPSVSSSFSYSDMALSGLDRAEVKETSKVLGLGMHFGQAALDSSLNYRLQWEDGTLVPMNFTAQQIFGQATAHPSDRVTASIGLGYFIREPTLLASDNPRFENSRVDGHFVWDQSRETQGSVNYAYTHAYATEPSLRARDMVTNTGSADYRDRISAEWAWRGSASASVSQIRLGEAESSAAGQSVGLAAEFARPTVGATLGARVGVLEPEGGSTALAYGADASARANWQKSSHAFSLTYFVSYQQNLDARPGWAASQSLYAEVNNAQTGFLHWSARLQASSVRGGGGEFDANAQRTIAAIGSLSYRRAALDLQIGTSDSVTGVLSNPLSDGLFIPAGYNTHARYASVNGAMPLARTLAVNAFAKYAILSGPATPNQRESVVGGALSYALGRWTLSLNDVYTTGGTISFGNAVNQLYVRASMAFGRR